ncbi:Flp pilus assembly protein TadG [Nocardioides marinisabuli]|uniref:Flp pilus assembly protein TadG n=1 Tax=Nocardioides marinisabuli TaxID=419476 RepID=A0A7Y9F2I4_9ACTN|nr:TadE/TadG family type IV pilus assembly protein [Nocardioides marinisabuli]NYD58339.1 Flp pilus assembly protein TadG [Nocardioides marinisabuli]
MAGGVRRAPERERGAAAVEFALVVPLLLVLVFGIISYGYMLSFRQSISQAAAEGARAAALAPPTVSDRAPIAFAAIQSVLGVPCNSGYLSCVAAPDSACGCIDVTVSWDYAGDPSKPKLVYDFALPATLSYTASSTLGS